MKNEAELLLPHYIQLWDLSPDGNKLITHSSLLQPVLYKNNKAILKIPMAEEEKAGSKLMIWWNGVGAAKVYEYDENAILMERIIGSCSLTDMSANNQDDEASRIICHVVSLLHNYNKKPIPELITLEVWFKDLFLYAEKYGEVLRKSADIAKTLLINQRDIRVLHGDLHHGNILHSAERGWLAIDPKGIIGERTFDYANILCNPNQEITLKKGRLERQLDIICREAKIDFDYLLKWVIAWAGLSATWSLNDGDEKCIAIEVANMAMNI